MLIEDVGFNAFFAAANRALRSLGADLGVLEPDIDAHAAAIEDLWHGPTGQYCSRDAVTHQPLLQPTIATFLPLLTGTGHAAELVDLLAGPRAVLARVPGAQRPGRMRASSRSTATGRAPPG